MTLPKQEQCARAIAELDGEPMLTQWEADFVASNRGRTQFSDAQRDRAEDRLGVAKTALHIIANIWQTRSEACADNSRAGELMAEQARRAIAKLTP